MGGFFLLLLENWTAPLLGYLPISESAALRANQWQSMLSERAVGNPMDCAIQRRCISGSKFHSRPPNSNASRCELQPNILQPHFFECGLGQDGKDSLHDSAPMHFTPWTQETQWTPTGFLLQRRGYWFYS
jgi:hypothetical protein